MYIKLKLNKACQGIFKGTNELESWNLKIHKDIIIIKKIAVYLIGYYIVTSLN